MTAITIPNLSGLARMVPVHDAADLTNVGANWSATAYTVPDSRVLALDHALLVTRGGTLPTAHRINLHDSAGALQAYLTYDGPGATYTPAFLRNTVWVAEAWTLRFRIIAGAASTDVTWSFSGRLFDWVDVT